MRLKFMQGYGHINDVILHVSVLGKILLVGFPQSCRLKRGCVFGSKTIFFKLEFAQMIAILERCCMWLILSHTVK